MEDVFDFNSTFPVSLSGFPSSAEAINYGKYCAICFFATTPGEIEITNPHNFSVIVYYSLSETSGLD